MREKKADKKRSTIKARKRRKRASIENESQHALADETTSRQYGKIQNRFYLTEKPDVVLLRKSYLYIIRSYRNDNFLIYFLDETWLWEGIGYTSDWMPTNSPSEQRKLGLSPGPSTPPHRGKRAIVSHCMGEHGLVDGALDIFCTTGKKRSEDYHEDMDENRFEAWFTKVVHLVAGLGRSEGRPVALVLDNAPYHKKWTCRLPRKSDKKPAILEFCRQHNITNSDGGELRCLSEEKIMPLIAAYLSEHNIPPDQPRVQEIAQDAGVRILYLPPYQCTLNPIEQIWALMKADVRKKMSGVTERVFSHDPVENFARNRMHSATANIVKNGGFITAQSWSIDMLAYVHECYIKNLFIRSRQSAQRASYKISRGHLLTEAKKAERLQKCKKLRAESRGSGFANVVFSDEKIFTIEAVHNSQNHRQLLPKGSPRTKRVERSHFRASVMVWAGICATGKTPLVFVEKGVKIDSLVYQRLEARSPGRLGRNQRGNTRGDRQRFQEASQGLYRRWRRPF
ncbi:hypothetical protein QR680_012554 [Steinernema hermaphroditum]|uniref:Tc1-like transposase DDE domain-containing protein n=1 Tax=Steinernema hermaphroditum TaxID=289476 RepID=A0AA39I4Y0_9BILA|nr:hypothetical protein QR680_012554 [Steinernema hermaphroditum]